MCSDLQTLSQGCALFSATGILFMVSLAFFFGRTYEEGPDTKMTVYDCNEWAALERNLRQRRGLSRLCKSG
jgi:hypothetical protein